MLIAAAATAGCTKSIDGYHGWASGEVARAYRIAEEADHDEAINSAYSRFINEPVGMVAQQAAQFHGLAYWGYASEEAARTPLLAEIGPVSSFALFSTLVSIIDMALEDSAVVVADGKFDIIPLYNPMKK